MATVRSRPLILSLGGINMDLVTFSDRLPADGETVVGRQFVTYAGGKGANQAVTVARMGVRSAMVGRVGDDMFGPELVELLQSAGVETGAVGVSEYVSSG
ncbi:MAG: PfkB family carbohydrate kinase, partial [Chloroflexi bacterium]|nr:PfkB family carbohydrate kinase [Chloroflexota bacterium]